MADSGNRYPNDWEYSETIGTIVLLWKAQADIEQLQGLLVGRHVVHSKNLNAV